MGTKANPGEYDCYDKAEPDEPMFVLLARDLAQVSEWPGAVGAQDPKLEEAWACADAMDRWRLVAWHRSRRRWDDWEPFVGDLGWDDHDREWADR